ncbi:hypothetical protein Y1Q_0018839 [Alligator mississippiensis]|uniref:Secreted protein n=1 Tax=Alligator mississippiensis TaxID=8496 RepID=A0A151N5M7_ALLMI|nr:hypothetical protein Y1Q_0018839 [Alligator mississippiensis]
MVIAGLVILWLILLVLLRNRNFGVCCISHPGGGEAARDWRRPRGSGGKSVPGVWLSSAARLQHSNTRRQASVAGSLKAVGFGENHPPALEA